LFLLPTKHAKGFGSGYALAFLVLRVVLTNMFIALRTIMSPKFL